jgi:hypothetical protein
VCVSGASHLIGLARSHASARHCVVAIVGVFLLHHIGHGQLAQPLLTTVTHHLISLTHSPTHSLSHCLTHSLSHTLTHSLYHTLTVSLSHTLTVSHTHCLTVSLTHSLGDQIVTANPTIQKFHDTHALMRLKRILSIPPKSIEFCRVSLAHARMKPTTVRM